MQIRSLQTVNEKFTLFAYKKCTYIFAAYYRCGFPDGNVTSYDSLCTKLFNFTESQFYDVNKVHDDIKDYYRRRVIENPTNLQNKRLYVYTGLRNELFTPSKTSSGFLGFLNNLPMTMPVTTDNQNFILILRPKPGHSCSVRALYQINGVNFFQSSRC